MSLSRREQQRWSLFLAITLHLVLVAALFVHFATKATALSNTPAAAQIINATIINNSPPTKASSHPPAKAVPLPPKEMPVKQEPAKQEPIKPVSSKQEAVKPAQVAPPLLVKQAELKKQAQQKVAEHMQQELAAEEKRMKAKQKLAAKMAAEQAAKQLLQQELNTNLPESHNDSKADAAKPAALSAQAQGEIDRYKTLIVQAISQQWIVPDNLAKGLEAKLLVTLAPGGMVIDVKVTQSSGDALLDRSAQTAVYKASPLPVPADSSLFNRFRTINLIVRPEGIVSSS